ncbi:MAG TPA: hypothetical protein VGD69_27405 [Herpetosiphonaceae bacterium]
MALRDDPHTRNSLQKRVLWPLALCVAAILPPLYLVWIVLTQTVDLPFADQWALLPLLERSYQGTLTLRDLWAQHNEHRLLFPRLIMLALARLSGWNTHVEMLANIALAAGIFGVLAYQLRATASMTKMAWIFLLPALSLAIFSLNQAENWWGGWNIQIFLNVLAVSASIVLLAQPAPSWWTLALAALCGFVATYSYSTGLLIWPIGALALLLTAARGSTRDWLRLGAWGVSGAIVIGSFFYAYIWNEQAPPLAAIVRNPRPYLTYAAAYLGAPPTRGAVEYLFGVITGDVRAICNLGDSDLCGYVNSAAITAGVTGLALFIVSSWALLRACSLPVLLPYLALGCYALSTGVLTSLGRAVYGNHQALAQRYATTATLFWIALLALLALCAQVYADRRPARVGALSMIALVTLLIGLSTLQGPDHFRWQYEFLAPARQELLLLNNDEMLQRIYPDPQVVREGAEVLRQHRLSVFR